MNLAIVGCGYVADFYCRTLPSYPALKLVGAYDRNAGNLDAFCRRWPIRRYGSLDDLLADPAVEIVLNLTNPRSHDEVTERCLAAGKHVYSEKPVAMTADRARELVELARRNKLYLASAPCSLLSDTAQTLWKALRDGAIGRARLVYANFDSGMIAPMLSPWLWRNSAGAYWPAKDEFETGAIYEHAGYLLTWLAAFFGPARRVTSFAACLIPEKGIPVDKMAPDFAVGCIEYEGGVVARLTSSLVAPEDRSLTIIGDHGVLRVGNVRDDHAPVYVRATPSRGRIAGFERRVNRLRKLLRLPGAETEWHLWRRYPMAREKTSRAADPSKPVDFCRGVAELAEAIAQRRACRLSAELGGHVTELIERLQYPERFAERDVASAFAPIAPLPLGA